MALLNKGIKLISDQTVIGLNNRLFETAAGTGFITIRPDVATANGTVTLLDPGSTTAGYIKLAIQHVDVGLTTASYYFVIQTLGTSGQTINTMQSERISYGNEVTFGFTYDAAAGKVSYAISGNGLVNVPSGNIIVNTPTNISAFATGVVPVVSGLALTTTKDTPLTIGANKYNGFLSKVATYSTAFSVDDLKKYVEDPSVLPTANQVILLDVTQLAGVSSINTSVAEVQKLSFGAATNSGVLTIDGLAGVNGAKIVVTAGDSGAVIAEKVRANLVDSLLFKPQLEKQLITFTANTVGTSFKVAGVAVTVLAADSAILIANKVKAALDGNAFITGTAGRAVQDNGDGSVLVTFASADGDAKPIAVDSLATTITASVDTVQTFHASGIGRKVTTDGASVLIGLNPADLNAKDLYVSVGGTGVTVTTPAAAIAPNTNELTSFIPSAFNFEGTPVGETQRFIVTKPAINTGETLTFSGSIGTTTSTFASQVAAYTSAQTAAKIATDLNAAVTANTITNVDNVVATGDFVDIKFKPTAGNVANITLASSSNLGMPGILTTPQQFAQNLQGESQTVTFTAATNAGSITVDNIPVALTAADSPSAIATKVQAALVNSGTNGSGTYSAPEIQTITFLTGTGAAAAAGTFKVNGVSITTAGGETTTALLTLVTTALNAVVAKNYTAAIDGDSVKVTFHNVARDTALMAGVTDLTGSAASITATAFSTTQEFNANGIRATRVNSDGSLSIDFATYEGTLGNVLPIIFTDTGTTATTASVATTQEARAVKLTSSSYTGGAVTTSGAAVAANVMYAELVSVSAPVGNTKKLVFDVFVDPVAAARVGGGYESVGFTLNYPSADIASGTVKVDMATSSSSPITNLNTAGEIVIRWLDSASVTDFSKRIARITVDQQGTSGMFKDNLDLSFTNVDIDGIDFTDGVTNTRTFADTISADRWDIKQKLVNGLDATTPIGGEFVGYYGNPTVSNPQLTLKYASLKDTTAGTITLTNPNKTLGIEVVSGVAAVKTAKFAIELPSDGSNFSFALSPAATAAGLKLATGAGVVQGAQGRTYVVQLDVSNVLPTTGLAKDATIGTLSLDLNGGKDKTHEFVFNGTSTLNGNTATPQGMYFGYTATETQTINTVTGLTKGEWRATDMPKGTFNKFFVDVIPSNAAKVITSADALQILKLSAGYGLDWKIGTIPNGTFAAADMDGSGKVTAADALIALKYATGIIPTVDPVKWKFYDSSTANLSVESARITEALRAGMTVTGGADLEITASNAFKDYFVQAILVGNVTNPALEI